MRVERVVTNETCNQHCGFCTARRSDEVAAFVRGAASRIREAAASGAPELVLAGGEPALRRDLPELVALAKKGGVARVVLETNAATIDAPLAARLAASGLAACRVKIPAWNEDYERITEDPGSFPAMLAGIRALDAVGIWVEGVVVVVASNAAFVEALPAHIAASIPSMKTLVLRGPEAPQPARNDATQSGYAPLRLDVAARILEGIAIAARRVGLAVRLDPDRPVAPCLFPNPSRSAHLHALTPGGQTRPGYAHVAACAECLAKELCPGLPLLASEARGAIDDGLSVKPITDARARRRLTLISTEEEQIERELVTRETHRALDGTSYPVHTIRVQFQCNQSCHFCFVSTHLPAADGTRIEASIEEAGRVGAAIALSGGEPTLNPRLVDYVRLARRAGAREVELQTNAIRLADPARVAALAEAGVDVAFVSLHGSCAEVSDRVTAAPGTFERTVVGIDQLVRSPIRVRLNFVFCGLNANDFVDYVEMVGARWPSVSLTVSVVAPSTDLVPRTSDMIPRYGDVKGAMARGIARARELGLAVTGFESMCALPLCLVPDEVREYLDLPDVDSATERGEFIKIPECDTCRVRGRCWGIRRGYADLHGTGEIRAITAIR